MDSKKALPLAIEKDAEADICESRRTFIRTAAQVAVTAPAVSILLAGTTTPAAAQISVYDAVGHHILDDFTFGNNEEDIDAVNLGSNFNPQNGTNNQDDVFVP